jgi:hypothetical protein
MLPVVEQNEDDFGGLGYDLTGKKATIYIVAGRASFPTATRTLKAVKAMSSVQPSGPSAPGDDSRTWVLRTATVKHSLRELMGPMDQTKPPEPWRSASRGSLNTWYVEPNRNAVVLGVTKVTPAIQSAAMATYGDLVVVVAAPPVIPATTSPPADRPASLKVTGGASRG